MSTAVPSVGVTYFGKLPSQRDFVKSTDSHQLLTLLDRWAEQGLELLASDVDWKHQYDDAPPLCFAFVGSRSRVAVAGHFAPAHDVSGRRYPFLSAARIEVDEPLLFMTRCPIALSGLWDALAAHTGNVLAADDAQPLLDALAHARIPIRPSLRHDPVFERFLEQHSIGSLQDALAVAGEPPIRLKRTIPALGLLLQPLLTAPRVRLERGLTLPLPRDRDLHAPVATLWLDLVAGFVSRGRFELAIAIQTGARPRLVLGFDGASGPGLHALLDRRVAATRNIELTDPEWVDDAIAGDPTLARLASYLAEDGLGLGRARDTFAETFLGA